jgi:hypothetical protein
VDELIDLIREDGNWVELWFSANKNCLFSKIELYLCTKYEKKKPEKIKISCKEWPQGSKCKDQKFIRMHPIQK